MNALTYKRILYFISLVILSTLCSQLYWNYKNYQVSKQQLTNDVRTSLDNAVDAYFTNIAAGDTYEFLDIDTTFVLSKDPTKAIFLKDPALFKTQMNGKFDSIKGGITIIKSNFDDSLQMDFSVDHAFDSISATTQLSPNFQTSFDFQTINELSSKIMISFSENRFSLPTVDSLFKEELNRKKIDVDYGLTHNLAKDRNDTIRGNFVKNAALSTSAHSPLFFHKDELKAHFPNISFAVLKRNLLGVLLSFFLLAAVVGCLLYLLKIIQQQKELAAVKNDLISNITHEFKTPLATIGIAMEAIQNFNETNDSEKNLRYAKISREQVGKLNLMVEKLLETATLDSDKVVLNLEPTDLVSLIEKATQKEVFVLGDKSIRFVATENEIQYAIDVFHFENAINNVIDNAIKYGGDDISVEIKKTSKQIEIVISDTGNSLTEFQKKQLFEKFYRVPKGNTHDVKGFGIGLYYTKTIIEKHKGTIDVVIKPSTCFTILLPNG